jgi:hypothetical protein
MRKLQKQVAISAVAYLSLWDPLTADRLAGGKFENILNPIPILKELAQERNWENTYSNKRDFSWHKGMENKIDGEIKIHSAALAISGVHAEISRRIWSAEVGILFPFVEKKRHEILNQLNEVLLMVS